MSAGLITMTYVMAAMCELGGLVLLFGELLDTARTEDRVAEELEGEHFVEDDVRRSLQVLTPATQADVDRLRRERYDERLEQRASLHGRVNRGVYTITALTIGTILSLIANIVALHR